MDAPDAAAELAPLAPLPTALVTSDAPDCAALPIEVPTEAAPAITPPVESVAVPVMVVDPVVEVTVVEPVVMVTKSGEVVTY